MSNWKEMINASFLNGTKLSKEVIETEVNRAKIKDSLMSLRKVIDNLTTFKNGLVDINNYYNSATEENLDIETLRRLNSEAKVRNKMIDNSFEMTLNGLSAKQEGETEEAMEKRLAGVFKLPVVK